MTTGTTNWAAVAVATVLIFASGAVYYGMVGDAWLRAAGITMEQAQGANPAIYGMAALGALCHAWFLAQLINAFDKRDAVGGVMTACFTWGFVAFPVTAVHNAFGLKPYALTAIDTGHTLLAFVLAGAVLGAWRPKEE